MYAVCVGVYTLAIYLYLCNVNMNIILSQSRSDIYLKRKKKKTYISKLFIEVEEEYKHCNCWFVEELDWGVCGGGDGIVFLYHLI